MVEIVSSFRRSSKHNTVCGELVNLYPLKLEDALDATRRTRNEHAFGAVVTKNEIHFTDFYSGFRGSVGMDTVNAVKDDLVNSGLSGEHYLFHTHPRSPTLSKADFDTFMGMLGRDMEQFNRDGLSYFDGFFVVGDLEPHRGQLLGLEIERRPTEKEWERVMEWYNRKEWIDPLRAQGDVSDWARILSDYVMFCKEHFDMRI